MPLHHADIDAQALRSQLMAPEPTRRVTALHALEVVASQLAGAPNPRLAGDVERFASRGIPFYAPHDAHYCSWVDRAVDYWNRLQREAAPA